MASIVVPKKGQTIPADLLIALQNKNKVSMTYAAGDSVGDVLSDVVDDKQDWVKTIPNVQEACKGLSTVFYFEDSKSRKQQPQPILVDGEAVVLSAITEGEFPKFKKSGDDGGHNMIHDFIDETIKDLYQEAGQDVGKLLAAVDNAEFRKDLLPALGDTGSLLLIPCKGDPVFFSCGVFSPNGPGLEGPWGWTSNACGFNPAAKENKPLTAKEKLQARLETLQNAPGTSVPLVNPEKKEDPDKTDTRPAPDQDILIYPDKTHSQKQRRTWLYENLKHEVSQAAAKAKDYMGNKGYPLKQFKQNSPYMRGDSVLHKSFKAAAEAIHAKMDKATADTPKWCPPILNPQTLQHVVALRKDGRLQMNPNATVELETVIEPLTSRMAINRDVPLLYSFDTFQMLAAQNAMATAHLLEEFRRRILADHPEIVPQMLEKLNGGGYQVETPPAPAKEEPVKIVPKQLTAKEKMLQRLQDLQKVA